MFRITRHQLNRWRVRPVVALVVLLVRRMLTTQRITVTEDIVLGGDPRAVEPALVTALSSIEGAQHMRVAPGLHAVVLRRIPAWAIIPVFLIFPVGLVFLFVRESVRMDLALFDSPSGAVLRLSGRTEKHVLERVRASLHSVALV